MVYGIYGYTCTVVTVYIITNQLIMNINKAYHRLSLLSHHLPFSLSPPHFLSLSLPRFTSTRTRGRLRTLPSCAGGTTTCAAMSSSRFLHLVPINAAAAEGDTGVGSNGSVSSTAEDEGALEKVFLIYVQSFIYLIFWGFGFDRTY